MPNVGLKVGGLRQDGGRRQFNSQGRSLDNISLLKRMEAQGLLRRARAKDDERQVIVSLTARGLELKRRAAAGPDGVFCATECSPEELVSIRDHLFLLRAKLLKNA